MTTAHQKSPGNADINLSEISVLSAHDVDEKALADFYNNNPLSNSSLIRLWKWKFDSPTLKGKIPLVMAQNGRVVAHIGLIPFEIFFRGNRYKAAWLTDISISQEIQNRGAGVGRKLAGLAKRAFEFSDLSLGISNEAGINFLKHFGWIEFPESYFHVFSLLPVRCPASVPLTRRIPRAVFKRAAFILLKHIYKRHAAPDKKLYMESLTAETLGGFLKAARDPREGVIPLRDTEYAERRLMRSPDRGRYRVAGIQGNDMRCVIKLKDGGSYNYIDILWLSDQSDIPSIKEMISSLAVWGIKNNYSMIRCYTSHKALSDYLKRRLRSKLTRPRFNFYARDKALLEEVKNTVWNWQLIDSDFELFQA